MDKLIEIDELKKENKKLEQDLYIALNKIDKAIEYIKNYLPNYDFDHSNLEKLLEILGDKDGTSNNQSS